MLKINNIIQYLKMKMIKELSITDIYFLSENIIHPYQEVNKMNNSFICEKKDKIVLFISLNPITIKYL